MVYAHRLSPIKAEITEAKKSRWLMRHWLGFGIVDKRVYIGLIFWVIKVEVR